MYKEMEKPETPERKQAPKHIGRKLAALITGATELIVPATQVLADGVPTPDKPTSVTGPAVPGKETIKKEVPYRVSLEEKDLFPTFTTLPPDFDYKKGLIILNKNMDYVYIGNNWDHTTGFKVNNDFEVKFGMALFNRGQDKNAPMGIVNFDMGRTGLQIMMLPEGKLLAILQSPLERKAIFKNVPQALGVFANLRVRFENIDGKSPETIIIYNEETGKELGRIKSPISLFPENPLFLDFGVGNHPKTNPEGTEMVISHFKILVPETAGNVEITKPKKELSITGQQIETKKEVPYRVSLEEKDLFPTFTTLPPDFDYKKGLIILNKDSFITGIGNNELNSGFKVNNDFEVKFGMALFNRGQDKNAPMGEVDLNISKNLEDIDNALIQIKMWPDEKLSATLWRHQTGKEIFKVQSTLGVFANLRVRFENIDGKSPETIIIYNEETGKELGRIKSPISLFPEKSLFMKFNVGNNPKTNPEGTEMVISHFKILVPEKAEGVKIVSLNSGD